MLKKLKDIVRKSSIHVCIVNCGGCNGCDVELVALLSPRYDLEQYGIYVHNNPREADVLLVTGAVTEQWRDNLRRIYAKTPEPKIVVAVGNCPQSGDVFAQEGGRVLAPVSDGMLFEWHIGSGVFYLMNLSIALLSSSMAS